jgi:hypothetical protein
MIKLRLQLNPSSHHEGGQLCRILPYLVNVAICAKKRLQRRCSLMPRR